MIDEFSNERQTERKKSTYRAKSKEGGEDYEKRTSNKHCSVSYKLTKLVH